MFDLPVKIKLSKSTRRFLRKLFKPRFSAFHGVEIMFKVKTDNPDVAYKFSKKVTDSEGNEITDPMALSTIVTSISSSNEDAVQIIPDAVDNSAGSVHFGNPGLASIDIVVKEGGTGKILGSGSFGVTVVTGDPAAVSDIRLDLAGLVDDEPAPVIEETTKRRR